MSRKEVAKIITEHPGELLYVLYGRKDVLMCHEQISKTRALRNAKLFHSVRCQKYIEERPDLQRYRDRQPGWGESKIVTFDATEK